MIKGLSEYEKFKVMRPIIGPCQYDALKMPVIRKTDLSGIDLDKLRAIGVKSASPRTSDKNTLVLMHAYDKYLLSMWNDPLKKVALFQGFAAVGTPDFSLYPGMNENDIRNNIYMSRWLGVTWQNYNCIVLPTIGWALPDTYDICFSGVEYESPVIISTLGCDEHKDIFLDGFKEMRERINPPLIIVFGNMIPGMTGTFINFKYTDSFCQKYRQLEIEGLSRVFTIEEVA